MNNFVGEFEFKEKTLTQIQKDKTNKEKINNFEEIGDLTFSVDHFLSSSEIEVLSQEIKEKEWIEVGQNGILSDYKKGKDQIGSYRASVYSRELSDKLWNRLKDFLPSPRQMNEYSPTDHDGHLLWKPTGINPLFRFIYYKGGGTLVPHYDAPFIESDSKKTLMSLVIYIDATEDIDGGSTRFIKDSQIELPLSERDYSDWERFAQEDEIIHRVNPHPGTALIFDHRILHDSEEIRKGEKIIVRSDIVFEKVTK